MIKRNYGIGFLSLRFEVFLSRVADFVSNLIDTYNFGMDFDLNFEILACFLDTFLSIIGQKVVIFFLRLHGNKELDDFLLFFRTKNVKKHQHL